MGRRVKVGNPHTCRELIPINYIMKNNKNDLEKRKSDANDFCTFVAVLSDVPLQEKRFPSCKLAVSTKLGFWHKIPMAKKHYGENYFSSPFYDFYKLIVFMHRALVNYIKCSKNVTMRPTALFLHMFPPLLHLSSPGFLLIFTIACFQFCFQYLFHTHKNQPSNK